MAACLGCLQQRFQPGIAIGDRGTHADRSAGKTGSATESAYRQAQRRVADTEPAGIERRT